MRGLLQRSATVALVALGAAAPLACGGGVPGEPTGRTDVPAAAPAPPPTPPATRFPIALRAAPSAGPVLAGGGRVLWVERRGDADALVSAVDGQGARDVLVLPAVPTGAGARHWAALDAVGDRAVLERRVVARGSRARRADLVRVDLATGAATRIDGCHGDGTCVRCVTKDYNLFQPRLGAGGVVVLSDPCGDAEVTLVRRDGTRRRREGGLVALGGPRALLTTFDRVGPTGDLAVVDLPSGRRVGTMRDAWVEAGSKGAAIADDGTTARAGSRGAVVLRPGARKRVTVAPAAPSLTDEDPSLEGDLDLAGRWLVQRSAQVSDPRDGTFATFAVTRRDGSRRRTIFAGHVAEGPETSKSVYARSGAWDLDGTRLTWAAQPCGTVTIEVWHLAGAPPAVPGEDLVCPRPEVTGHDGVYAAHAR